MLATVTAAGLLAGPVAAEVLGDPADRDHVTLVLNQALETERTRIEIPWWNPATGHRGGIVIERTFYKDTDTPCRDYRRTVDRPGAPAETLSGTGCRIGPAKWTLDESAGAPANQPQPRTASPAPAEPVGAAEAPAKPRSNAAKPRPQPPVRAPAPPPEPPFPGYTPPAKTDL
jgi:surface antigen